jgi:hypothetical protein
MKGSPMNTPQEEQQAEDHTGHGCAQDDSSMTTAEPNVPAPAPAGEALVQQIAEALRGWWHQPPGSEPFWVEAARAVLPLVEAQVAPLRDEVERLTESGRNWHRSAVANSAECLRAESRAFTAESALRQVREDLTALADAGYSGTHASINSSWRADIAAVLARVGAADTQPEGAGEAEIERLRALVDLYRAEWVGTRQLPDCTCGGISACLACQSADSSRSLPNPNLKDQS